MRVLVVSSYDTFGTGERTRNLINNIKDFDFDFITPPNPQNKFLSDNINIIEITPGAKLGTVVRLYKKFFKRYDLFHGFKPLPCSIRGITEKFRGVPFLLDWDDIEGSQGLSGRDSWLRRNTIDFSQSFIARFADRITVVSPFLEKLASRFAPADLIPNGVDTRDFTPRFKSDLKERLGIKEELIVFTGILGRSTDLDFILESMRYVERGKLLVVGDGPRCGELKEYSRKMGVGDKIIWYGLESREKIPGILASSDIGLLPMKKNMENEARFPIKFGEYMASGLPIVTNNVGAVRAVIENGKNGILTQENPKDFGEAINRLVKSESLRKKISKGARETAKEKLEWKKISARLEKIYKELVHF